MQTTLRRPCLLGQSAPAQLDGPGVVLAECDRDDIASLLALHSRLEGGSPYPVELVPVGEGSHPLRQDTRLEFFTTDHWVPNTRRAFDLDAKTASARARGRRSRDPRRSRAVGASRDSGPGAPPWLHPRRGCSWPVTTSRCRPGRFGHLQIRDVIRLPSLRCKHLVILHASRRHRRPEVEAIMTAELEPRLDGDLHHLIVDWD